jgi:manganese transport protein
MSQADEPGTLHGQSRRPVLEGGTVLGAVACLRRPCDFGKCRLHGSRQLGNGPAGGAQFKYGLLWVVGLASLMAIFMQVISARLGVVTGKDLAQCCRDWYPKWTRWPNWLMSEVAIGACDLAEVLGSAVALNLLFHIPLLWAVIITGLDVLLLLGLQRFGMRTIEAVVLLLVATISVCYYIEYSFCLRRSPAFWKWGER